MKSSQSLAKSGEGLERGPPVGYLALRTTVTKDTFWFVHSILPNLELEAHISQRAVLGGQNG